MKTNHGKDLFEVAGLTGLNNDQIRQLIDANLAEIATCDALVAFVPYASMGTAVEMYEAFKHGCKVGDLSMAGPSPVLMLLRFIP